MGDSSIIEDCYIGRLEGCASFSQLYVDPGNWNFGGPEQSNGRKCTRVEVMNLIARTGQKDIDSNKGKSAWVNFPVRATEHALYESHVRIHERQTCHIACFDVGLRHHAADVRQSDLGVKICDCGGFCIDGIERRRTKHVICPAERRRATRDRNRSK